MILQTRKKHPSKVYNYKNEFQLFSILYLKLECYVQKAKSPRHLSLLVCLSGKPL